MPRSLSSQNGDLRKSLQIFFMSDRCTATLLDIRTSAEQLSWLNMAATTTRNDRGPGLWMTWSKHYRLALPSQPLTALQRLRTRQELKRNWNSIGGKNRNEHLRLGRSLCDAIILAGVSAGHAADAQDTFDNDQTQAILTPAQMTASAENMYRALIQYLQNLVALVRIEDEIGAPAAVLRALDGGERMQNLIDEVDDAGETVAGLRHAEVAHLGTDGALNAINTRRDAFLNEHFDQGPDNTFVGFEGGNEDSRFGIWIQSDANGRITDRVVVKDVCFELMPAFWSDRRIWHNLDQPFGKELVETYLMKKLQETGSPNVVRLRDSQLHVWEMLFRVSVEHNFEYSEVQALT